MNDEASNSNESQTQTSSINSSTSNVWKYYVNVDVNKYMCQICNEKNPHYNTIINKNAHKSTTKFWRHLEIFHVTLHDHQMGKVLRKKKDELLT